MSKKLCEWRDKLVPTYTGATYRLLRGMATEDVALVDEAVQTLHALEDDMPEVRALKRRSTERMVAEMFFTSETFALLLFFSFWACDSGYEDFFTTLRAVLCTGKGEGKRHTSLFKLTTLIAIEAQVDHDLCDKTHFLEFMEEWVEDIDYYDLFKLTPALTLVEDTAQLFDAGRWIMAKSRPVFYDLIMYHIVYGKSCRRTDFIMNDFLPVVRNVVEDYAFDMAVDFSAYRSLVQQALAANQTERAFNAALAWAVSEEISCGYMRKMPWYYRPSLCMAVAACHTEKNVSAFSRFINCLVRRRYDSKECDNALEALPSRYTVLHALFAHPLGAWRQSRALHGPDLTVHTEIVKLFRLCITCGAALHLEDSSNMRPCDYITSVFRRESKPLQRAVYMLSEAKKTRFLDYTDLEVIDEEIEILRSLIDASPGCLGKRSRH